MVLKMADFGKCRKRSKLPETPLTCLQMHFWLLMGFFVCISGEFARVRNWPIAKSLGYWWLLDFCGSQLDSWVRYIRGITGHGEAPTEDSGDKNARPRNIDFQSLSTENNCLLQGRAWRLGRPLVSFEFEASSSNFERHRVKYDL